MISKQKILFIVIAVSFFVSLIWNLANHIPESRNYDLYKAALKEYDNHQYIQSYSTFGQVSRFSKLKPAAVFRQALCADKLEDVKIEIKKYKETTKFVQNIELIQRAKYLLAQQYYEKENYRKAEKRI